MTEEEFWKSTPRKLFALDEMRRIYEGSIKEEDEGLYMDQVLF